MQVVLRQRYVVKNGPYVCVGRTRLRVNMIYRCFFIFVNLELFGTESERSNCCFQRFLWEGQNFTLWIVIPFVLFLRSTLFRELFTCCWFHQTGRDAKVFEKFTRRGQRGLQYYYWKRFSLKQCLYHPVQPHRTDRDSSKAPRDPNALLAKRTNE